MSECVVRMEMPQDGVCDGCGARTVEFLAGPICAIEKKFLGSSRPSWCPIICSLPEGHGRLVDEKEVKDWVENWLYVNKYYHPYSRSKSIPVSELYDVLQRMDAAVPAERSEA